MFKYIVIPNPSSTTRPFRAIADLGPSVEEPEFLAKVVALSGKDLATVTAVLQAVFAAILFFVRDTRRINTVLGLFTSQPTISGSFPTADPSAEDVKKGIDFTIAPSPEQRAAMIAGLSIEKTGEQGPTMPHVDGVTLQPGNHNNACKALGMLQVRGQNLRDGTAGAPPSAILTDFDGSLPVTLVTMTSTEGQAQFSIPATLTSDVGHKLLVLTATVGANTRTTTYATPLTLLS